MTACSKWDEEQDVLVDVFRMSSVARLLFVFYCFLLRTDEIQQTVNLLEEVGADLVRSIFRKLVMFQSRNMTIID